MNSTASDKKKDTLVKTTSSLSTNRSKMLSGKQETATKTENFNNTIDTVSNSNLTVPNRTKSDGNTKWRNHKKTVYYEDKNTNNVSTAPDFLQLTKTKRASLLDAHPSPKGIPASTPKAESPTHHKSQKSSMGINVTGRFQETPSQRQGKQTKSQRQSIDTDKLDNYLASYYFMRPKISFASINEDEREKCIYANFNPNIKPVSLRNMPRYSKQQKEYKALTRATATSYRQCLDVFTQMRNTFLQAPNAFNTSRIATLRKSPAHVILNRNTEGGTNIFPFVGFDGPTEDTAHEVRVDAFRVRRPRFDPYHSTIGSAERFCYFTNLSVPHLAPEQPGVIWKRENKELLQEQSDGGLGAKVHGGKKKTTFLSLI